MHREIWFSLDESKHILPPNNLELSLHGVQNKPVSLIASGGTAIFIEGQRLLSTIKLESSQIDVVYRLDELLAQVSVFNSEDAIIPDFVAPVPLDFFSYSSSACSSNSFYWESANGQVLDTIALEEAIQLLEFRDRTINYGSNNPN